MDKGRMFLGAAPKCEGRICQRSLMRTFSATRAATLPFAAYAWR